MDHLLNDLVVVEASRDVAVRYCGRLFAQLGATVIRAAGGDDTAIGYAGAAGEAYGGWLDAGKRDAATDDAVDLVIAGMDAAGVEAGRLLQGRLTGKPGLLELNWFHADGPYGAWRGSDELIQALCGVSYCFGLPVGPPTLAQGHGPQVALGVVGFNAALGALFARPRPRRITANAFEAYMCLSETAAMTAFMEGGASVRLGVNRFVPTYPCGAYRTADGYLGVTALTPAQWKAFCRMLGREDIQDDPRYDQAVQRLLAGDEVDAIVAPPLLTRPTDEWVRLGIAERVPLTPMPDLAGLPLHPHWRDRGSFAPFDASGRPAPAMPFKMTFGGRPAPRFEGGPPARPLDGVRVVDFSMGWAGPLCARTLADLGAEVIKIESDRHRDWWRGWETDQSGDPPPWETKYSFISVNRNKRAIILELGTPEGLARAKALIAQADVLVENFAAGTMEAVGLGPQARRALNPDLIAVSMPAFGLGGPLSGVRAYGSTVEQASGLPFANGHDHWAPSMQHVAFGDPIAGLYGAAAALAALWARQRRGGVEIDLGQVECLFQFAADALIAQQVTLTPLPRTGSRRPRAAPVCVVRAAGGDDWLAVAAYGEAAWKALCSEIGEPGWADDRELATIAGRNAAAERIEAAISAWAAGLDREAAAARLQAIGVAAAPVRRMDELGYEPQLSATGFWDEMDRRYVGRHIISASPFAYDGARPALRRPAPTLGEHTAEVLAELDAEALQVT